MAETTGATGNVEIKRAIQSADVAALPKYLREGPSRANTKIRWGKDDHILTHPLHFVCDMLFDGTLSPGQEMPLVEALLEAGSDVDGGGNGSPLNAAASLGAEEVGSTAARRRREAGIPGAARRDRAALGCHHRRGVARRSSDRKGIARGCARSPARCDAARRAMHRWNAPPPPWEKSGKGGRHLDVVRHLVAAGATVEPEWLTNDEVRANPEVLAALGGESSPRS